VEAHSGQEALDLLKESPVDVVLLDIEMPGLDGYETTQIIKQTPELRHIPVILVSGVFTEDPYVKKGYESGAVDFFTKPFDAAILRYKVGVYASLTHKAIELEEKEAELRTLRAELKERDERIQSLKEGLDAMLAQAA
jgi:CheY-like chemotaxis protein